MRVPICICSHPLDYHDELTAECRHKGCGCLSFQASGKVEILKEEG